MTDGTQKTLLLIDGHSMAFRAFYALPAENFSTTGGQHTNAVYGFLSMFVNILTQEKPTHLAVAFDVARETFRNDLFPEYKAQRAPHPGGIQRAGGVAQGDSRRDGCNNRGKARVRG